MNFNKSKKMMPRPNKNGFTLVELLVTITIMGIIATAAIPLLSTCLEAYSQGNARSRLYQEGLLAMERMTSGVRRCTFLLIPNNHTSVRDILAFSGTVNDDNDYYFNDTLFPRIDEDLKNDMDDDLDSGIDNIDDDGDGNTDEGISEDDDEDGETDEEIFNGIDDDGDGNVDEDLFKDINRDDVSGFKGMDDDGDGNIDNQNRDDDDEDGNNDEDVINPTLYIFDSGTNTLTESIPSTGETTDLSTHVTQFQVTYEAPEKILITLTLTGDEGKSITFTEYVCPRNTYQKTGKRVRWSWNCLKIMEKI